MATGVEIAALVAASVQAGVESVKAVADLLTSGRSVIIEVDNNTDLTLTKFTDHHESGGFAVLPKLAIPPRSADVFGSQSKGGAVGAGTVGSVTYAAEGLEMLIGWNNAFVGDNKTNVGPDNTGLNGRNSSRRLCIHQTGVGNQGAHMRFMLFIHPPYSLKQVLKDKGVVLKGECDLVNKGFRALFPGVTGIREILPNSTAMDAT